MDKELEMDVLDRRHVLGSELRCLAAKSVVRFASWQPREKLVRFW